MKFRGWKEHYLIVALKIFGGFLSTNFDFIAVFCESSLKKFQSLSSQLCFKAACKRAQQLPGATMLAVVACVLAVVCKRMH